MQRTLKRELKELEIVKREAIEVSRSISLREKFSFLVGASLGGRVGRGMVGSNRSSFSFSTWLLSIWGLSVHQEVYFSLGVSWHRFSPIQRPSWI
jgi:hypothetical protein